MTNEQAERLLQVLGRIATALEDRSGATISTDPCRQDLGQGDRSSYPAKRQPGTGSGVRVGSVSDLGHEYLDLKRHEWSPQHHHNAGLILWAWDGWLGWNSEQVGVELFTRTATEGYRDHLLREGRSPATVNQHLTIIGGFLKWCGRGDLVEGVKVRKRRGASAANQRAAFTDEEVRRIFRREYAGAAKLRTSLRANEGHARYWLPLICLYTGARPEEVAQLRVEDVKLRWAGGGGCWSGVFDFATVDEGQRRKTEAARRMVPVHPELIRKGLVLLCQSARPGLLFPELKPGANGRLAEAPSRWFNRTWLRDRCGIKDTRKVLYSLRHTVATRLKHAGVEESLIAELLGHTNGSMTTGRYGKAYPVEKLAEAVALLEWKVDA